MSDRDRARAAFAGDRSAHAGRAALKAAWWGATGAAARLIAKPAKAPPPRFVATADPAPRGFLRRSWLEAFEKDARDVAEGLYPAASEGAAGPLAAIRQAADFLLDARQVEARRRRGGATEARDETPTPAGYPAYYRQNFHFQTGGWFTEASARRYEAQVETLFSGAAGAMRRRALSLLARAWRARDHRGATILDLACGSGAFLKDLAGAFPRARLAGVDLSSAYLSEARRRSGVAALAQANGEALPFADASLDAVTAIYLFHELPPAARRAVAGEIGRVLRRGGLLAFADAAQAADDPRLARLLEAFPAYFHEPFFDSYAKVDLIGLFGSAGLTLRAHDRAFLTKALLFEKG